MANILYFSHQCPDTPDFVAFLNDNAIPYEAKDVSVELKHLKEFIQLRDKSSAFNGLRGTGALGVPCLLMDNEHVVIGLDCLKTFF